MIKERDCCGAFETSDAAEDCVTGVTMPDHEVIYLIPDGDDGASWCGDPAPGADMDETDAIKYIRFEDARKLYVALTNCDVYTEDGEVKGHFCPRDLLQKFDDVFEDRS